MTGILSTLKHPTRKAKAAACTLLLVATPVAALVATSAPADAQTYNSCYNVNSTTSTKIVNGNTLQVQVSIKCDTAQNVLVRAKIQNVYCYSLPYPNPVIPICRTKNIYPWGSGALSGYWGAGQTRTATWNHGCEGNWLTGDNLVSRIYGGNYGYTQWSTDGGAHWSKWIRNNTYHVYGC